MNMVLKVKCQTENQNVNEHAKSKVKTTLNHHNQR